MTVIDRREARDDWAADGHAEDELVPAPEERPVSADPEAWVNAPVIDDEDGDAA